MQTNRAFTIVEMLVGAAIFTLVMTAAAGFLVSSLKAQGNILAQRALLDETSYVMEYMSRAVRMAKKDLTGACVGIAKSNYAFDSQCLKFVNYKNQCQQFCLDGTRLKDENGNYLTSEDLMVENFNVALLGENQTDNLQPKAGIFLDINGKENANIKIQTTISQRNLDIKR